MRIIVAHSMPQEQRGLRATMKMLLDLFESDGSKTQELALPPLNDLGHESRSLISYRMMPLAGMCDALLCLDAHAAVLSHPKKIIWLLDGQDHVAGPKTNGSYVANVLRGSILEADQLFAPTPIAARMRAAGWKKVVLLDPPSPQSTECSASVPGKPKGRWAAVLKAVRS